MAWPTNRTEFGPNRTPVLVGLGYQDETSIVPIAVDETTGYLLTSTSITPSGTQDVNLKEVGGTTLSLGQSTMAASLPVTLASNQSALGVTQSGSWSVGTKLATQVTGQTTSGTSAVQLSSTSSPATNGIIVQALSANSTSVFIGVSGVTKATGFELQPGQAIATSATNINVLYVIGSNTSDGVCWIVT